MMISASSRARVLNGETTMCRIRLRNAIIEDQPTRSCLSFQRGWSFRQGQVDFTVKYGFANVGPGSPAVRVNCWRNGSDANAPTKSRRLLCIALILKRARGRPSLSVRQWTPDPLESESARLLYDLKEETPNETAGNSSSERVPGR